MNSKFSRKVLTSGRDITSIKTTIKEIFIIDSRYQIKSLLHSTSGICDIYLSQDLKSNRKVVLKVLKPSYSSLINNKSEQLIHEGNVIANMRHPNIIQIISNKFTGIQKSNIKKKCKEITYIPIEYAKHDDLLSLIKRTSFLSENVALYLFKQILSAVNYIHINGICHRDIKLDNILLDENFNIKLADFEYAENIYANGEEIKMRIKLGTVQYGT